MAVLGSGLRVGQLHSMPNSSSRPSAESTFSDSSLTERCSLFSPNVRRRILDIQKHVSFPPRRSLVLRILSEGDPGADVRRLVPVTLGPYGSDLADVFDSMLHICTLPRLTVVSSSPSTGLCLRICQCGLRRHGGPTGISRMPRTPQTPSELLPPALYGIH